VVVVVVIVGGCVSRSIDRSLARSLGQGCGIVSWEGSEEERDRETRGGRWQQE
jgi:phage gp37-like protein